MSKSWITEIDSDIGKLKLKVTYEYDSGSSGDYYTPGEEASVNITDIEVVDKEVYPYMVTQLQDEILDEIHRG